jgi:hypothetical protein
MRKAGASKERHECCPEGSDTLKEVSEGPFSADRIADQQGQKINGFIAAEASSDETDLISEGIKQLLVR